MTIRADTQRVVQREGETAMTTENVPLTIEEEALLAEADKVEAVREWVERQSAARWSPGWSDEFKRGYDAALEEVSGLVSQDEP